MMNADVGEILRNLGAFRARLEELTGGTGFADAVQDVADLSEQLLLADEELRVQQDQLSETNERLLAMAGAWQYMFGEATTAYLLTTPTGVITNMNAAARRLVAERDGPTRIRPLSTKFAVADRRAVRDLISRVTEEAAVQAECQLMRGDGVQTRVCLLGTMIRTPGEGSQAPQAVIWWRLQPVDVAGSSPVHPNGDDNPAVLAVADAALSFSQTRSIAHLLQTACNEVRALLPGCFGAELLLTDADLGGPSSFVSGDPAPAKTSAQAPPALLSVPVRHREVTVGTLLCWNPPGRTPTAQDRTVVAALLVHLDIALRSMAHESKFRSALQSRDAINKAVGIVMSRRGVQSHDAFASLLEASRRAHIRLREIAEIVLDQGDVPTDHLGWR